MDILDMSHIWKEGDGEHDVRFLKQRVETVLRELQADERLADCQHFAFKEYNDRSIINSFF